MGGVSFLSLAVIITLATVSHARPATELPSPEAVPPETNVAHEEKEITITLQISKHKENIDKDLEADQSLTDGEREEDNGLEKELFYAVDAEGNRRPASEDRDKGDETLRELYENTEMGGEEPSIHMETVDDQLPENDLDEDLQEIALENKRVSEESWMADTGDKEEQIDEAADTLSAGTNLEDELKSEELILSALDKLEDELDFTGGAILGSDVAMATSDDDLGNELGGLDVAITTSEKYDDEQSIEESISESEDFVDELPAADVAITTSEQREGEEINDEPTQQKSEDAIPQSDDLTDELAAADVGIATSEQHDEDEIGEDPTAESENFEDELNVLAIDGPTDEVKTIEGNSPNVPMATESIGTQQPDIALSVTVEQRVATNEYEPNTTPEYPRNDVVLATAEHTDVSPSQPSSKVATVAMVETSKPPPVIQSDTDLTGVETPASVSSPCDSCVPDGEEGNDDSDVQEVVDQRLTSLQCLENEFTCYDQSKCLSLKYVCDGTPNCKDSSDENSQFCDSDRKCKDDYVQCGTTAQCVHKTNICDGVNDCLNGYDEMSCKSCVGQDGNTKILKEEDLCDGIRHCFTGWDESPVVCTRECPSGYTKCDDGLQCIRSAAICDGSTQCQDKSDESQCDQTMLECGLSNQFSCDGRCKSKSLLCDGTYDCQSAVDETGCNYNDVKSCPNAFFLHPFTLDCIPHELMEVFLKPSAEKYSHFQEYNKSD